MEKVIEKICNQVLDAFHTKKPLVILDTDEIQLAIRVAARCNVVDLKHKKPLATERYKFYYDCYIKAEEEDLSACENFSTMPEALVELIKNGKAADPGEPTIDPKLILFHITSYSSERYYAEPAIVKLLRDYVKTYISCFDDNSPIRSSCVILYGDHKHLPNDLQGYIQKIVPDYPSVGEIRDTIDEINEKYGSKEHAPKAEHMDTLARNLRGFTLVQVESFIKDMLYRRQKNGAPLLCDLNECKNQVLEAKVQNLMRFGGLLKLHIDKQGESANKIGGMENYKQMVLDISATLKEGYVSESGSLPYKGAIVVGVPGCGKSEAAKLLHSELNRNSELNMPMLKLDMGTLMGGLVGLSERNLREALRQCEQMSPCVLFIDEIEKALSGSKGSNESSSDTARRMFGYLLDWLNEDRKVPCFVFATANDIGSIPREFVRNGRFNIRYAAYMPTHSEIKGIFAEQMKRAERLRNDTAKEEGKPLPGNIFADNCFEGNNRDSESPAVPDSVVELFVKRNGKDIPPEKIKFVSGADIKEIVNRALGLLENKGTAKPFDISTWEEALESTIDNAMLQTQGSSKAGRNAIAACYIRLLRRGFVPLNDSYLFDETDYYAERNKGQLKDAGINKNYNVTHIKLYDEKLSKVLRERIDELAFEIEEIEYKNECKV